MNISGTFVTCFASYLGKSREITDYWKRVDYVLTELQRTYMDAQDSAQQKLQDWLKGVDNNLKEVKVPRTWVQTPLCLRERNATDFIPAGIHPRELNVKGECQSSLYRTSLAAKEC